MMTRCQGYVRPWAINSEKVGVTKVWVTLFVTDSIFYRHVCHPKLAEQSVGNWYAAPVSGLNLNDNCLDLSVGFDDERRAQLIIAPAVEDMEVEPIWLRAKSAQTLISPAWESLHKLKVRVTLGSRSAGPVCFTVQDPTLFFANVLRNRFNAYGISIDGSVEFRKVRKANGDLPDELTVVGQYRTPIFCAALRANRTVRIFCAECLIKTNGF